MEGALAAVVLLVVLAMALTLLLVHPSLPKTEEPPAAFALTYANFVDGEVLPEDTDAALLDQTTLLNMSGGGLSDLERKVHTGVHWFAKRFDWRPLNPVLHTQVMTVTHNPWLERVSVFYNRNNVEVQCFSASYTQKTYKRLNPFMDIPAFMDKDTVAHDPGASRSEDIEGNPFGDHEFEWPHYGFPMCGGRIVDQRPPLYPTPEVSKNQLKEWFQHIGIDATIFFIIGNPITGLSVGSLTTPGILDEMMDPANWDGELTRLIEAYAPKALSVYTSDDRVLWPVIRYCKGREVDLTMVYADLDNCLFTPIIEAGTSPGMPYSNNYYFYSENPTPGYRYTVAGPCWPMHHLFPNVRLTNIIQVAPEVPLTVAYFDDAAHLIPFSVFTRATRLPVLLGSTVDAPAPIVAVVPGMYNYIVSKPVKYHALLNPTNVRNAFNSTLWDAEGKDDELRSATHPVRLANWRGLVTYSDII